MIEIDAETNQPCFSKGEAVSRFGMQIWSLLNWENATHLKVAFALLNCFPEFGLVSGE